MVVLLDYPRGLGERSADILSDLLRTGPAHGISFLIHHDPAARSGYSSGVNLDQHAHSLFIGDSGCTWTNVEQIAVSVDRPSARQLEQAVAAVAAAARNVEAPRIEFSSIQQSTNLWSDSTASGITAAIGRCGHETVTLTLGDEKEQRHNLLVTGAVGQGKSNFLKVLIHSMAVRYSPRELEFYLLDFKDGVTFFPLAPSATSPDWLPHAKVIGVESDRPYGVTVLEHLFSEFDRRARLIKPYGDNIASFRERAPDAHMPRIVAVIDEFHVLFEEDDPTTDRAVQLLERLSRRGRAYGIHLVLASQTISGITALIPKEGGIYSQFPIRVALKNSVSESRAILDANNTGAAKLRFRGEAIVNQDFGQVEGNRRAVIAVADDRELAEIRHRCWNQRSLEDTPPAVFNGSRAGTLSSVIPELRLLRARAKQGLDQRMGVLGAPIAVTRSPIGVSLSATPGRHLAVAGAGKGSQHFGEPQNTDPNLAIGAIQAAALSLALQHPAGDAEFTILSYLTEREAEASGIPHLTDVLERLGFAPIVHTKQDATSRLQEIASQLGDRGLDHAMAHYVLAFAIDRAGSLDQQDAEFTAPVDRLRTILRDGPVRRTHLLGWWSSVGVLQAHLGYETTTTMDAILALRVEQRDITELMGYNVTWSPRDNRGLLFDRTQFPAPVPIVPMAPLDQATRDLLLRTDWDAT
ncbi:Type VII secretion system protein EccCa1 [Actinokineospora sp. UTMC 2448]|nr:Type VII secretion system protein EccCa1 [Actinokineospora sp. UTMC 2448]